MISVRRAGDALEWGGGHGVGGGPLTWRPIVRHRDRPAPFAQDLALVTCPNGHEATLSGRVHAVATDGTVSPSYVCPYGRVGEPCSFHNFIKLEGWTP